VRAELAPGVVRLVAFQGEACAEPKRAELSAGHATRVELALTAAVPVAGRVTDAATGQPVADARVAFWTFAERDVVHTDAQGRFLHPRFPRGALSQQIVAEARGHGRDVRVLRVSGDGSWKLAGRTAAEAPLHGHGTPWIELALVPESIVSGRVSDERGQALAGARVVVEGYFHVQPAVASRDGAEGTTGAEGEFRFGGLRSDVGHALSIEAPGFARRSVELAPTAGSLELGTLVLVPEALLAGSVIDQGGMPVAALEVVLEVLDESAPAEAVAPLEVRARPETRLRRMLTSEEGTFVFEGLAATAVRLVVERDDGTSAETVLRPRADGSYEAPCLVLEPRVVAGSPRESGDPPSAGADRNR
jgi:protocatechuate 3,4-dioxygenase beta subunit